VQRSCSSGPQSDAEIAFLKFRGKNGDMNALAAPGTPRPSRSDRSTLWRRLGFALLAPVLLVTSAHGAAQEPTPAIWKARDHTFPYRSSTAVFSCTALAGRVASILRELGARDDIKVKTDDCIESSIPPDARIDDPMNRASSHSKIMADRYLNRHNDPHQFVHVRVHMMMPTEVTPEVLAELKKDKSRRELISHVTGNPAIQFNDPIIFSAQWQPVTLSRKTIGLAPEECELLDQMSATIFRDIGLQVVQGSTNCTPGSRIAPELVVKTLVATPAGTVPPEPTPAEEEDEQTEPGAAPATDAEQVDPAADQSRP
jgi:hypothetical protein